MGGGGLPAQRPPLSALPQAGRGAGRGGGRGGRRGVPARRRPLTEGGGAPAGQRGAARLNPGRAGPGRAPAPAAASPPGARFGRLLNLTPGNRRAGVGEVVPTLPGRPLGAAPSAVPPARSRPRSRLLCASEGCRLSLPAANLHLNRRPAEGRRGRAAAAAAAEGNSQPAGGSGAAPQVPNPRSGARRTSLAERALNHGPRGHVQPPNGKGREWSELVLLGGRLAEEQRSDAGKGGTHGCGQRGALDVSLISQASSFFCFRALPPRSLP